MIDLLRTGIRLQYNTNKDLRNYLEMVFREHAPTLRFDAAFLVNDFHAALDCLLKPTCSLRGSRLCEAYVSSPLARLPAANSSEADGPAHLQLTRPITTAARACAINAAPTNLTPMLQHIPSPVRVQAAGTPPKIIEEFIGRVASQTTSLSIARMTSPPGWSEPGQTPEFDEFTVVLRGMLRLEIQSGVQDVAAGQAVIAPKGQWVRYSTPGPGETEYVAVCVPAFSLEAAHRDPP